MKIKKRRTNREIIQSKPSKFEHSYAKTIRGELIPTTKSCGEGWVELNERKINKLYQRRKGFFLMHTHPYWKNKICSGLPSDTDLINSVFEKRKDKKRNLRGLFILQRDKKTGEWQGTTYYTIQKNKLPSIREVRQLQREWNSSRDEDTLPEAKETLNYAKKLNVDLRFHPARGYYFNKNSGSYEKKEHNLEKTISLIFAGFALIFLLNKFSFIGFVINNSALDNPAIELFALIGLFFFYYYFCCT